MKYFAPGRMVQRGRIGLVSVADLRVVHLPADIVCKSAYRLCGEERDCLSSRTIRVPYRDWGGPQFEGDIRHGSQQGEEARGEASRGRERQGAGLETGGQARRQAGFELERFHEGTGRAPRDDARRSEGADRRFV